MRYMLMRKADADTENAVLPTADAMQAMADYNERMSGARRCTWNTTVR